MSFCMFTPVRLTPGVRRGLSTDLGMKGQENMTQETQCIDSTQEVQRELAEDRRTEAWKMRMRAAYVSGDVERITRFLRPVNCEES